MTTYAPNFTPRYKAKYHVAGLDHTIQLRTTRGASSSVTNALRESLYDMFNVWSAQLAEDFAWISAEYALTDSDIFFPGDMPDAVLGGQALAEFSVQDKITSTGFVGKAAGSKAKVFLYGISWNPDNLVSPPVPDTSNDFRVQGTDNANVLACQTSLNLRARANSGEFTVWYPYANIKPNDRLLALARRGLIT